MNSWCCGHALPIIDAPIRSLSAVWAGIIPSKCAPALIRTSAPLAACHRCVVSLFIEIWKPTSCKPDGLTHYEYYNYHAGGKLLLLRGVMYWWFGIKMGSEMQGQGKPSRVNIVFKKNRQMWRPWREKILKPYVVFPAQWRNRGALPQIFLIAGDLNDIKWLNYGYITLVKERGEGLITICCLVKKGYRYKLC